MVTYETENSDELMDEQIGLVRQGLKSGLAFALAGLLLCLVVMLPVALLFLTSSEGSPDGLNFPALIAVSVVAPVAGLGILGAGLYRLIPLYIQYRRAKRPDGDEDMFP